MASNWACCMHQMLDKHQMLSYLPLQLLNLILHQHGSNFSIKNLYAMYPSQTMKPLIIYYICLTLLLVIILAFCSAKRMWMLWFRKGKEDAPENQSDNMYTFSSIESQKAYIIKLRPSIH
ncbi:unnamed protein product [Lactuca saligna]|uniref:Uncharacterized protein n=1 Tax=Lactuca saligna TaxID=75948 RepID=A0AA36E8S7_LACSI|nr:unnamed protein product [Lactuca saligna]